MTNLINDNLMQMARPGARSHAPIPAEIQRWEDDGGAIVAGVPARRERSGEYDHESAGELVAAE